MVSHLSFQQMVSLCLALAVMLRQIIAFLGLIVLAFSGSMLIGQADENVGQDQRRERAQRDSRERRGGDLSPDERRARREEFRRRMAERMRERLEVNDEEWAALEQRIEKIMQLQSRTRVGFRRGFGRRSRGGREFGESGRPRGQGAGQREPSAVQKRVAALRKVLDDDGATNEQITKGLTELRKAREEARAELDKARKDLRDLVTLKQEAFFVLMGFLN